MSNPTEVHADPAIESSPKWPLVGLALLHFLYTILAVWFLKDSHPPDVWPALLMGAMASQPMLCGWWSAWSNLPLVWRLPTGMTVCFVLSLAAATLDRSLVLPAVFLAWFLVSFFGFWLARKLRGWRIAAASESGSSNRIPRNQFSIRYLLFWTTILAVLVAITKTLPDDGYRFADLKPLLSGFLAIALLCCPSIYCGCIVLARRQLAVRIGILFLLSAVAILLATWLMFSINGSGPHVNEVLLVFGSVSCGGSLSVALSAWSLTRAGYRILHA